MGANCHGIVTLDVLVEGLSCGAITTRKLKGVNQDKGHEVYTGSAPCGEGKSLRSSFEWDCLCLDYQGANPLDLALDLMLLVLNRRRVIPLYTEVDTQWPTESRPVHKQCPTRSLSLFLSYNTSYTYMAVYLQALSHLWALGL